jgi:uncharacterized lipoprotein YmbA
MPERARALRRLAGVLACAGTLLLGVTLWGCASSPPTEFFALTPAPSATPASGSARLAPVRVAAVHIPSSLDRLQMVREQASGRIEISSRQRWVAPLDEMVRNVLTQNLLDRLPGGSVVLPQQPAPSGTRDIVLDIVHFAADGSGTVALRGTWSLLAAGSDTPQLTEAVALSEMAVPNDFAGQAAAMSRALARLADQISERLGRQLSAVQSDAEHRASDATR